MIKGHQHKAGFTLIEILIVVMLLGIMGMIIVPQLENSGKEAKEVALSSALSELRSAFQLYSFQHKYLWEDNGISQYIYPLPGLRNHLTGEAVKSLEEGIIAFNKQLFTYSNEDGITSDSKSVTYKYGPYLRGNTLPVNPFNGKNDLTVDKEQNISNVSSDGTTGWKLFYLPHIIIANDGDHDDL